MRRADEVKALPVYTEHVNRDACSRCAGACCKQSPAPASPEDFGSPDRALFRAKATLALRSGLWCVEHARAPFFTVDWAAIDMGLVAEVAFLQPAATSAGACVFLRESGCAIFHRRPTGCRTLKPKLTREGPRCTQELATPTATRAFLLAWAEHYDDLRHAQMEAA